MKKILLTILIGLSLAGTASAQATVPAGGTGTTTFPTQQILYGSTTLRLSSSPLFKFDEIGSLLTVSNATTSNLTALKLWLIGTSDGCATFSSGLLTSTGSACGSGSGTSNWTRLNNSGIYPATSTDQVIIGNTATTSLSKLEVTGGALFDRATTTSATSTNFFATTASTSLLYASNVGIGTTSASLANLVISRTDQNDLLYLARTGAASLKLNFAAGRINLETTSGGLNLASSLTDGVTKTMRFTMPNYDAVTTGANCVILGTAAATTNVLNFGGGSTQCSPPTQMIFSLATSSKVVDGGTVAMIIDSFGRIGQGTQLPTSKLHVVGLATTTSDIFNVASSTTQSQFIVKYDGSVGVGTSTPTQAFSVNGNVWITGNATSSTFTATSTTATSTFPLLSTNALSLNGTYVTSLWSTTTDSLAFDTLLAATTTLNNLNVLGGLASVGSSTGTTTIAGGAIFNGNVGIGTSSPYAKVSITNTGTSPSFIVEDTTSPDTSPFIIDASGSVGIGAALLTGKFNVEGGAMYNNNGNTVAGTTFFNKRTALFDTGDTGTVGVNIMGRTGQTADFFQIGSTTQVGDVFTVKSTGNVGIASTTPYARLSVRGLGITTGVNFQTTNSNNDPLFTILDNGSVGIGSSTLYDSVGGTSRRTLVVQDTTNNAEIRLSGASAILNLKAVNGDAYVGTQGESRLIFQTNNTSIGAFSSTGNLGIGTTTPDHKLNIVGTYNSQLRLGAINTSGAAGAMSFVRGDGTFATGFVGWAGASENTVFKIDNGSSAGEIRLQPSHAGNTGFVTAYSGGAETLRVTSGNLGLGTTSPYAKLSVVGQTVAEYFTATSTTATSTFSGGLTAASSLYVLQNGNVGIGNSIPNADLTITNLGASDAFKVEDSATPDTTPFIINTDGNVGIGTTSAALASLNITRTDASNVFYFSRTAAASHALNFSGGRVNHITTSGGFNLASSLDDATSKTMRLTMPNYDATTSGVNCVINGTAGETSNSLNFGGGSTLCFPATQLIFSIATSSKVTDGGTVTMLMDSFGRIGMGTQLPQAKLHVVGVATTTSDTFSVASSTTASQFIVKYDGKVGIATGTPSGVLSVQGSVFLNGLTSSTAGNAVCQLTGGEIVNAGNTTCVTSSKRFKTDIKDIDVGLKEVLAMKPRSYTRTQPTPSMPSGKEVGLIAEEVNEIVPRLVEYEADGVTPRGVNYQEYTAVLTKAIQEQQKQIDELKAMQGGMPQSNESKKYQVILTMILVAGSSFLIGKLNNTLKK